MRVTNYITNHFQYVSNTTDNIGLYVIDYSTFGSLMPGRQYSSGTGYRFGFNGKENDNEVKGVGNQITFEARIYDARLGRWLACDPERKLYPGHSVYNYALNSPIFLFDPNGKWVAKIDVNSASEYSLTFVAEKGDNLKTLSKQLGIPVGTLLKQDPSLKKIEIKTASEIKLDKINEVKNINDGINYIAKNQRTTNCANLADHCDGGTNLPDQGRDNNVATYEGVLGNSPDIKDPLVVKQNGIQDEYESIMSEKDAKIGDIIHYNVDPDCKEELVKSGGMSNEIATDLIATEQHFSVIILKNKKGDKVQNILQKNGRVPFDFKVDDSKDLSVGGGLKYKESKPAGSKSHINRRK